MDNKKDNIEGIEELKSKKNMTAKVTRKEFIDIMEQVRDNIAQMSTYLMQDMNTLYAQNVFPFQLRMEILEEILKEKGFTNEEDLKERYNKKIEILKEKAREIKEKNGKLEVVSEEEEKKDIKQKVLHAINSSNVIKTDVSMFQKKMKDTETENKETDAEKGNKE